MPVYSVSGGTTGYPSDLDQFTDTFNGANDTDITLLAQISPPVAPTVAVNTTAGNLTGNYQYAIAFVTGYWQGPVGSGTFHAKGNTGGGAASTTVSPNAQQVNLSNIPIGPTGVYERIIYRTDANGANFYYLTTLADNTTTTYTDDTADSGLGAAMPTTNTTGGKFSGDGSGLTDIPAANLTGGPIPASVLPPANTTTLGTVETAQDPASGAPIAVITNPASQAGQSINGPLTVTDLAVAGMTGAQTQSRYVGAVSGAAPTSGTFDVGDFALDVTNLTFWICTAAGSPGTWSNFNYLRLDANAPNPQVVDNSVTFNQVVTLPNQISLNGEDTSGTGRTLIYFGSDNAVHVGAYGNVYPTSLYGSSVGTPHNTLDDGSGNATFAGTVTAASGQLGSASGTWTPASGTFNVAAGTVINVASVPSAAKMYYIQVVSGSSALNYGIGGTTSSGSFWTGGSGNGGGAYSGSASPSLSGEVFGANADLYDGSYYTSGYFQLSSGYLRFVTTNAGTANTSAASNFDWVVS